MCQDITFAKELNLLECLGNSCLFVFWVDSFKPSVEEQMFVDSKVVPENVKLRAHSDLQLNKLKLVTNIVAADPCVTKCWRI